MPEHDVIIIGSGINSLVAGAILAKKGKKVLVLEKNKWLGGCIKTSEVTLPNFIHDELAAWHPLFVTSPGYRELQIDLESYGLQYKNTDIPTGVVLPNGSTAVMYNDRKKNIDLFNQLHPGDGDRYQRVMEKFEQDADLIFTTLSNEVRTTAVYKKIIQTVRKKGFRNFIVDSGTMIGTARNFLENNFQSEQLKALLVPWILHTGLGPDDTASNIMLQVLAFSLEQVSMPIPKGGGIQLVHALSSIIEQSGGELRTNSPVTKIIVERNIVQGVTSNNENYYAKHVLANVTPHHLYNELLENIPFEEELLQKLNTFTYGNAGMQIHYALSEQLQWEDEELNRAALINLTGGIETVSMSVNEALNGLIPKEPTIAVGQHTVLDPTRAPSGKHILWIQLLELPRDLKGDARNELNVSNGYTQEVVNEIVRRVENRIASHVSNFKSSILKRSVVSPTDLQRYNPNLVGGNPYAGDAKINQLLLWRPNGLSKTHETIIKNLYHIGASTHPGPGLSGTSGYLAAKLIK